MTLKYYLAYKPIYLILFLALISRLLFWHIYPPQNFPDAQAYITMGKEIFAGEFASNHIYMPLYPVITFITGGEDFLILFDILISVTTTLLIFILLEEIFT